MRLMVSMSTPPSRSTVTLRIPPAWSTSTSSIPRSAQIGSTRLLTRSMMPMCATSWSVLDSRAALYVFVSVAALRPTKRKAWAEAHAFARERMAVVRVGVYPPRRVTPRGYRGPSGVLPASVRAGDDGDQVGFVLGLRDPPVGALQAAHRDRMTVEFGRPRFPDGI